MNHCDVGRLLAANRYIVVGAADEHGQPRAGRITEAGSCYGTSAWRPRQWGVARDAGGRGAGRW
jgi:hypothetical protein